MTVYSLSEGTELVRAARHCIELYLKSAKFDRRIIDRMVWSFTQHNGISVSIRHYPLGEPRGSAGFVKGVKPINLVLIDAAIAAATEDRGFVPVSHHELEHIVIEVGVFSEPQKLKKNGKVGKGGVMVEYGFRRGFILPAEIKKGEKTEKILEEVCKRAGLAPHDSKRPDITFYTFTAQTFRETSPNGSVEEVSK
ncbi:MAG: TIGR00296 family protein [Candidatus Micrarchaeota archaeon]|nr:TIGR00296 family protein [Candidatus Micrarchaeota archaeon]